MLESCSAKCCLEQRFSVAQTIENQLAGMVVEGYIKLSRNLRQNVQFIPIIFCGQWMEIASLPPSSVRSQ
jgi:hypothetical protein